MDPFLSPLNDFLRDPKTDTVATLFDPDGFIRFNMLYVSPVALKHLRTKLMAYGLKSWYFTETGLTFVLSEQEIIFRGSMQITAHKKIYSVELDFDPIIPGEGAIEFLRDIEMFLKKCDACFFMTYTFCIDTEILKNPLFTTIDYLISRK